MGLRFYVCPACHRKHHGRPRAGPPDGGSRLGIRGKTNRIWTSPSLSTQAASDVHSVVVSSMETIHYEKDGHEEDLQREKTARNFSAAYCNTFREPGRVAELPNISSKNQSQGLRKGKRVAS